MQETLATDFAHVKKKQRSNLREIPEKFGSLKEVWGYGKKEFGKSTLKTLSPFGEK